MLKVKERDEGLYGLLTQYVGEQQQNRVYGRENSAAYTYAKGQLVGFCMACKFEIQETDQAVFIYTRNGRFIMQMVK